MKTSDILIAEKQGIFGMSSIHNHAHELWSHHAQEKNITNEQVFDLAIRDALNEEANENVVYIGDWLTINSLTRINHMKAYTGDYNYE